jgi:GntR family transcriptional regulator
VRQVRYRHIADDLSRRVEAGEFAAGRLLPSEAELSTAYGASRMTVRKALELLRDEGLIDSRQGLGWFAATDPLRQTLGRLGTIESQLTDLGIHSERRVLDFGVVDAPPRVRQVLRVKRVLEVRRVNLADGAPFARVTVWCSAQLGRRLTREQVERSPIYDVIGIPLGGAVQTIAAAAAGRDDAEVLDIPVDSPVLVCERTTSSADGEPVLLSVHVFPGHLTEFVVNLAEADRSIAPSGLRLVGDD